MKHLSPKAREMMENALEKVGNFIDALQQTTDMILASGWTPEDLAFYGSRVWMPSVDNPGRREANEVLQLDLKRRQLYADNQPEAVKRIAKEVNQ